MDYGIVEIFKTDVTDNQKSSILIGMLQERFPSYIINFDLDDCDNILRIESHFEDIDIPSVIEFISNLNTQITLIED
jgi:hypothetical protein